MAGVKFKYVTLEKEFNQYQHKTEGLNSEGLVVRRGQSFRLALSFNGPYMLMKDEIMFRAVLALHPSTNEEQLQCDFSITFSKVTSPSQWAAYFQHGMTEVNAPNTASVCIYSPPRAIVGVYQLYLVSRNGPHACRIGQFTLLCNPWCPDDSVYLPDENQREEYVRNDFGLLYQGTEKNIISRPWGFDLYENGILDICMMMLQVSNEHKTNWKLDYAKCCDPVYISRVVSAMINNNDDCGVLQGNWSEDYTTGINPTEWTESGSILKKWFSSGFQPVKYGQCWVFAAVMCTVMRVLGIPTRVVTNYNSAHDTNGNLVIEEYYTEKGEKLPRHHDSIWNFHVWVECWMKRRDLPDGFDGWQAVDPTPQEMSSGVYRCGPAPVRAIREHQISMAYDVPFIYAEVNADVHVYIVRQSQVLGHRIDTDRVGALICTKGLGSNKPQDITANYKDNEGFQPSINPGSTQGLSVKLKLSKVPVVGENIYFSVIVTNHSNTQKKVKEQVNAQAKYYDCSPSDTLWEADNVFGLFPNESKVIQHQIAYSQYSAFGNEQLVNLAVVIMDLYTQERVMASEEFNLSSPYIQIQVAEPESVTVARRQVAMVTFTNPFSVPVRGRLTVAGSGLLDEKVFINVSELKSKETGNAVVKFTPKMAGVKMLQATLSLDFNQIVIRGFRTITVQPA